jgi:hypothetical protein
MSTHSWTEAVDAPAVIQALADAATTGATPRPSTTPNRGGGDSGAEKLDLSIERSRT